MTLGPEFIDKVNLAHVLRENFDSPQLFNIPGAGSTLSRMDWHKSKTDDECPIPTARVSQEQEESPPCQISQSSIGATSPHR